MELKIRVSVHPKGGRIFDNHFKDNVYIYVKHLAMSDKWSYCHVVTRLTERLSLGIPLPRQSFSKAKPLVRGRSAAALRLGLSGTTIKTNYHSSMTSALWQKGGGAKGAAISASRDA